MLDTPTIVSSSYASMMHDLPTISNNALPVQNFVLAKQHQMFGKPLNDADLQIAFDKMNQHQEIVNMANQQRRLVKVIIIDPNENVPLEDCVLYSGDEKMTDATDQELFFEVDIKKILDEHNAKRVKLLDKKVKERTEHLEPAKIRELKMVVVNIAAF